jgi:hypothetical protein
MLFPENRWRPRINSGAGFSGPCSCARETTSRLARESGEMRVFCCRCQVILPQRNLVPATSTGRVAGGDPRARLPALGKSSLSGHRKRPELPRHMHNGSTMQGGVSRPQQQRAPHVAGLNSAIPSGVFRIGKGLLGETVQLALTMTISHREGARCDGHHILSHSEPSGPVGSGGPERSEIRRQANSHRNPRLIVEDDRDYGCLVISAQDARRVACDRCM